LDGDGGEGNFFTSALAPLDLIDGLDGDFDETTALAEGDLPQTGPGIEASGSSFSLVPQSDPLADMGLEQATPVA
jgi:hypothetical protein